MLTRTSRFVCFSEFVLLFSVLCKFDQFRSRSGEISPKFRLKTVDISIIFIILLILMIIIGVIAPAGISRRRRNPEEALQ